MSRHAKTMSASGSDKILHDGQAEREKSIGRRNTTRAAVTGALTLDTSRFAIVLLCIAAILALAGTFANIVINQIAASPDADIARVMRRFDLGHEPSLPAWYSSVLLLADGAFLLLIGYAEKLRKSPFTLHWLALGFIFIGLSIDEAVMFHEMIDRALFDAIPVSSALVFPWVIVGGLFVLMVFIFYLNFLRHLPRRFQLLFMASGAIYVGGAIGMESVAASVVGQHGVTSLQHTMVQAIEESLEMAGAILFYYSLSEYWKTAFGEFQINLKNRELV